MSLPVLHLNYHEIHPEPSSYPYSISTAEFEAHVRTVGAPPPGARATLKITFDDGHRTQYEHAFPILQRHGVKATFFVTAGFTERDPSYATWRQLREMAEAGHEIQAHGWRHRFFTLASDAELAEELRKSKEFIEDRIGRPVESLSFPGGRFDERVLDACRGAGYLHAFTSELWPLCWKRRGLTLFARFAIQNDTATPTLADLIRTGGRPPAAVRWKHGVKRSLRRVIGDERYHRLWQFAARSDPGPEENAKSAAPRAEPVRDIATRVCVLDLLTAVPYYEGELCAALRRQGADVTLAAATYYLDRDCFARMGVRPRPGVADVVGRLGRVPAVVRRPLKLAEGVVNVAALAIRFVVKPPEILHVQYLSLVTKGLPAELWLMHWARKHGTRIVYTVHDALPHDTGTRHASRFRRIYRDADALICHTREAARKLTDEFGIEPHRIRVIPHGPLFGNRRELPAEEARRLLHIAPGRPVVLCQGIIRPYKGVPFLLDAWPAVGRRFPEAQLVIAGTCPDHALLDSLRRQVDELGIQASVSLDTRYVSENELGAYYSLAEIVVYPYREITTSGAVMTGLARRRPIVATHLPAFEGLLEHGRNALLVEFGDSAGLSAALVSLLESSDERARLAAEAEKTMAALAGWDAIARDTLLLYRSLLER